MLGEEGGRRRKESRAKFEREGESVIFFWLIFEKKIQKQIDLHQKVLMNTY